MRLRRLTILAILIGLSCSISGQTQWTTMGYAQWAILSAQEQFMFVRGVQEGSAWLSESYDTFYPRGGVPVSEFNQSKGINAEYLVSFVNRVYKDQTYRDLPVALIVLRIDQLMEVIENDKGGRSPEIWRVESGG